jgi:2-polyprenyl-6-methoxyphenol hydroxylase-like FAD-dependent oxidoreductase
MPRSDIGKWSHDIHIQVPGSPSKTFLRPDLHDELKRLALFPLDGHRAPKIILDAKVVSVDIVTGTVTLVNGSTLAGDIIIGADGEHVRGITRSLGCIN